MPSVTPAISVVVCSLNGSKTIAACLDALEHQTVRDLAQLIVVDDGSTDATAEVARRFDVELCQHPTNLGISAARNTGIRAARAPIVAFTDDDCIPDRRWLEALLRAYERDGVVGVGGPVNVARIRTLIHRYFVDHPPLAPLELELDRHRTLPARIVLYAAAMWSLPRTGERYVFSFPGANMSFRASALHAVGLFDPGMTFGSDDEYICERIRNEHSSPVLWFQEDAVVNHDFVGSLRDLLRRNFAYGHGHAGVFLEKPSQRWPIVFPVPVAALVAVLATSKLRPRLAVVALVHLLLPQGLRAAIRQRRLDVLAFTWFCLAEEMAHNAGMVEGLWRGYEARRRSRPERGVDQVVR